MPKATTKAALAGLACLATVAVGTVSPATSVASTGKTHAGHSAKAAKPSVTRFGYNSTVYGTKVLIGGVEIQTLKDALVTRPCTRRTGLESSGDSLLSTSVLPQALQDIVSLSASKSHTQTYRKAGKNLYGVRGTSTIADVTLGGEVLGVATPALKIVGLKSVADSFYDGKAKKFGTKQSFGYGGLKLVLTDEDQISSTVSTLFDALGIQDPTTVINQVVDVPLSALLGVINTLPLELPGLGSISIGHSRGKVGSHGSVSEAYALRISLDGVPAAGIPPTTLQLGRAISHISEPVQAGVFRSRMSALDANIGGLLKLGGIGQRALPCEGTNGKVVRSKVGVAGVPQVLQLKGVEYAYKGVQAGKKANGFVQTTIGEVDLLQANVVLKGITSRVDLTSARPNSRVKSVASTKIGQLLIGGEEVSLPALGKWLKFEDSTGQIGRLRTNVLDPAANGFYGKHLTGVQIVLPGTNTSIDLAIANGEVFFR